MEVNRPDNLSAGINLDIFATNNEGILKMSNLAQSRDKYLITNLRTLNRQYSPLVKFLSEQFDYVHPLKTRKERLIHGERYIRSAMLMFNDLKEVIDEGNAETFEEAVIYYRKSSSLKMNRDSKTSPLLFWNDKSPNFSDAVKQVTDLLPDADQKRGFEQAATDIYCIMLIKRLGKEKFHEIEIAKLRPILEKNEKMLVFYPKRDLQIPDVDTEIVKEKVGEENLATALDYISTIKKYLYGQPVGDAFGANHLERRKWRKAMVRKYGETFNDICKNSNQFRTNFMSRGIMMSYFLLELITLPEHENAYDELDSINRNILIEVQGKDPDTSEPIEGSIAYARIDDDKEKLRIIWILEDNHIKTLSIFSRPKSSLLRGDTVIRQ